MSRDDVVTEAELEFAIEHSESPGWEEGSRISPVEVARVAKRFHIGYVDWICMLQLYGTDERLKAYMKYRLRALGAGGSFALRDPSDLDQVNDRDPRIVRATHEELAQLLGASREKVTRALTRLKNIGAVKCGRGYVQWLR